MSRSEVTELLERGAGSAPSTPDVTALWQQGRRRRKVKIVGVLTATVVVAVAVVGLALDPAVPSVDIGPVDDAPPVEPVETAPWVADIALPAPIGSARADLPAFEQYAEVALVAARDGQASIVDFVSRDVTVRELPELAPGDPPYRLIAGQRLVLYGGATVYAMDLDLDDDPEPIAATSSFAVFVPSGVDDRVWLRPGRTDGSPAEIRQITMDGTTLLGPATSPAGNIVIGLRDAVVLQRASGLIVWDPTSDQILQAVAGPYAMGTDGERFAWCDTTCRTLSVSHPAEGTTTVVAQLPEGYTFSPHASRISPNGRYLATPLCSDVDKCALTVIDLTQPQSWTVADGWLTGHVQLAWSPHSTRLFLTTGNGQILTYRTGDNQASLADLPPIGATYGLAAIPAPGTNERDPIILQRPDMQVLSAAATRDPSLAGTVGDNEALAWWWDQAEIAGTPPTLPDGTIGLFVIAQQAESTCRSPDDVLAVRIPDYDNAVVVLDPDGQFRRPCPGPREFHAYTAFVVAIPDQYVDQLTGAVTELATPER